MKSLVALLCTISAVVVSVFSYKCYSCISGNSTTCKESEVECLGDRCMTCSQFIDRIPVEDPTPNGVKCPSAYCVGTLEECNSTKEMNCTGSMKNCFQFRGEVQHPGETWHNYSAKGCANNDACKYNFDSAVGLSERPRRELIC
ncbi:uncharacterized protein ACNLHF_003004 isoform 2-T2 [Anomaloglossus baeobatrachus]